MQSAHQKWIEASLRMDVPERESHWTESIASGSRSFIEDVKKSLGFKAKGKSITGSQDNYQLRENISAFGYASIHSSEPSKSSDTYGNNTFSWREIS